MGDNISRQAAIDAIQKGLQDWDGYAFEDYRRGLYKAQDILEALPSTDRKGHWIMGGEPPWYVRECSECGKKWLQWSRDRMPNFCSECGADMRGADDESTI